jgi:hypothetical protein
MLKSALIFYNSESLSHIEVNKSKLEDLWCSKAKCVELKHSDPLYTADQIRCAFEQAQKENNIKSVLIDITTFSREVFLILIRLLRIVFPNKKIVGVYANASVYDSKHDNKTEKWLSKGIGEIRSVLGYPGDIIPSQKTYLIVIVGKPKSNTTTDPNRKD